MNPIINISFEDIFSTRYELEKDAEKLAPNLIDENAGMISLFRKKLSQQYPLYQPRLSRLMLSV